MSHPPLTAPYILAAATPLLVVLYLMIGRNWGGSKAGPAGYLTAIAMSVIVFGADLELLLVAMGRAVLLALFVLYIIWMALLLYHVVNDAGAIGVIGRELPNLATDKPSQALLLGWVFGSFLQGASGFGVPAAVVAPLLVGLGFAANPAVVIALVGHAWAVTFGSLGSSFFSLMAATGEPGSELAGPSAGLLAVACLACGFAVLWETDRWLAVRRRWLQLLGVGLVMAGVQLGLAMLGLWSLAAFGAGLAGLAVMVLDFRFGILDPQSWRRRLKAPKPSSSVDLLSSDSYTDREAAAAQHPQPLAPDPSPAPSPQPLDRSTLGKALVPYLIMTVIIVLGQLVFIEPLSALKIDPDFPEVSTRFGWITAAGPGRSISLLGHAGALLLYTCILSFLWFKVKGTFGRDDSYSGWAIIKKTAKGSLKSTIGIFTLVAMAVTMQHAAMTQILAAALSAGTGPIFPFLSPFIGALGAFMTGSNTNSNVVFGSLQLETAVSLGLATALILASQTAGGAIGSLFAPAKVIVGCSTVE
ncbi:MAG TPA: L-lactate permease, partial [candidate division Zixibacteria bacterium]|nr:L-lactate permease [candidate division Zixibacteria bacterium]